MKNFVWQNHNYFTYFLTFLILDVFYSPINCAVVQLTNDNFDKLVSETDSGIIFFAADWCPYCVRLDPIYAQASNEIDDMIPEGSGRVMFGKVDCEVETAVATRFHISKYPTLKMIRNGQVAKREYRGQRSVEALCAFVKEQLLDNTRQVESLSELYEIEDKKRAIVGFFENKERQEYDVYRKLAMNLKDDCLFYTAFGELAQSSLPQEPLNRIVFRPARSKFGEKNVPYPGSLLSFDELKDWTTEKCIPLVREITFENAEELTEEGLPFLILFHHPDDHSTVEAFTQEIQKQLQSEKTNVNFLTADGVKFAHPLHHLGKAQKDLPLIAIDSFRHMYLFPDINQMSVPGKMKQFVDDLYSGKLHREFHYGPDPTPEEIKQNPDAAAQRPTLPPESTFKKLAPNKNRYTILKDEL